MRDALDIAGRRVAEGEPTLVVAEAGVNHGGSLDTALELVDVAADCGVDAVKFQTFRAGSLAASEAPLADYQQAGDDSRSQLAMLSRLELSEAAFAALAERCEERGLLFLSTPFDEESVELLVRLGVPALKIGSGDLTNLPLLRHVGSTRLPVLLSTGMGTLDEVGAAVATLTGAGAAGVALLHCVSSYPAPAEEANLRAIGTLREAFSLPIGYSDHCLGLEVSLAAVALGACMLERHLTLDRSLPGPDQAISLEPDELRELVRLTRLVESALGDGRKLPQPSERAIMPVARRSLVAARDIEAGELVGEDGVAVKRPGSGMSPAEIDRVVGARLAMPIRRDEAFTPAHLGEPRGSAGA